MTRRSLAQWLSWQESLNPAMVDLGLERLRPVARRLRLTGPGAPLVTVAGTNGKGSTVAFLESLAAAHGLRSASYGSPWLLSYNESVRVDTRAVSDAQLIEAFERVESARGDVALTAFEFRTLAAVDLMSRTRLDAAFLEVGLGGRLDAVNLFDADVTVISSIGLDHREWLGDDLAAVAAEKAGVMRRGRPTVCSSVAATALMAAQAERVGAKLWCAQRDYRWWPSQALAWRLELDGLELPELPPPALDGRHQMVNAAGAIVAFALLLGAGALRPQAVRRALLSARLPGRLQRLPGRPECRVDVAHNPQAGAALARWLEQQHPGRGVRGVCAMYADKDARGTLAPLLPWVGAWDLASLPGPRGATARSLARALLELDGATRLACHGSVETAFQAARAAAAAEDLVLVLGSFEGARRVLRLASAAPCLDT